MKNYTTSYIRHVLNDVTGELEKVRFTKDTTYKESVRQGWRRMYNNGYDATMMELKSDLEKNIFIYIRDMFTKRQVEVNISQVLIARKFNTTPPTVNRLIKKLIDVEFLLKINRGVFRMNPFILIPYQADGIALQKEWTELMQSREED